MKGVNVELAEEVEHLRELEFGDKREPIVRPAAVSIAGILIYLYADWPSALVWASYFMGAFLLHLSFIFTRQSISSRVDVALAALLFANQQIAFGWFPVVLFVNDQRELMLVGGALIAAQLLFLVRRNDTLNIYQSVQIALVIFGSVVVYVCFLPILKTPIAVIGPALALAGLNYYFIQSLHVARRMRLSRSEAERQVHQAAKMAAIGQLSGGVAHDFNNNLTAIIGSLQLAKLNDDAVERNHDIDNALIAANQAAKTVEQLMIFARGERLDVSEIDTADVFVELVRLTERLIPASISLELYPCSQSLFIRANHNQLLSGLINLVANSIDAMPQGGTLTLRSTKTSLEAPLPMTDGEKLDLGDYVQITLEDSGAGIPREIIANVLEPFFTTKPVGKGTGLGLSMVSGMIRNLKGGLLINSSSRGTTISLFLPLFIQREFETE